MKRRERVAAYEYYGFKNAVNGIEFDEEKQEQMILELTSKKKRTGMQGLYALRQLLRSAF